VPDKPNVAVAVAVEGALRRLLAEIEIGKYAADGHALTSDDAYQEARTGMQLFDTFRARATARQPVLLIDVLGPLAAACGRHDYRDGVGARLCQTGAYADALAAMHSRDPA
jgi:hypothetical protein